MVRYLLFYILVVASVQSVINALMVGKPGLYRKAVMAFPCINSMKQRRILGRNTESHLRDNRNEFNAEDIASFIVDSAPTAQSVLNIPIEQENNPRQGKIYKSYQDFVSYIMKTPLWRDYSLSLTMKPVVTKSFSSMIGYFLGDIFAQLIFRKVRYSFNSTHIFNEFVYMSRTFLTFTLITWTSQQGGFNFARFLRMGAFGGLFHGPTGHLFYGLLERQFPGASTSAVVKKVS